MSLSTAAVKPGAGMPSNRSFGLVLAAGFTLIGLLPLRHGGGVRWWAVAASAAILGVALALPRVLTPANYVWFWLGRVSHRLVSPVVMAALFYAVITPAGLIRQLTRNGLARSLRPDAVKKTYWTDRAEPFSSMDRQF
jgi:hypothetical protein